MTQAREHLIHWLRDAYAMEHQSIEMLEKFADRISQYPDISAAIDRHAEESKRQADRLEQCLKRLGEETSTFKTSLGKLVGTAQALSGLFVQDEIVKGCVAAYVFEHYEIGNYKVLIAAAQAIGEQDIAQVCSDILKEEEAMAQWMEANISLVTQIFLKKEQAEERERVA